jgi:hypothetical protein
VLIASNFSFRNVESLNLDRLTDVTLTSSRPAADQQSDPWGMSRTG